MRKIDKDKIFPFPPVSLDSETTNRLRDEIIHEKTYPKKDRKDKKKYDARCRMDDIKDALKTLYKSKCAYCEQNINDVYYEIEHYRPKAIYYWLAYSWDNLFISCDKCNRKKLDRFEIKGKRIKSVEPEDLKDIHRLARKYNSIEKPMMINPELEDVEDKLTFNWNTGEIESKDLRCRYTIECCGLNRKETMENRYTIWKEFCKKVERVEYDILLLKMKLEKKEINEADYKIKYHDFIVELKVLIRYFKEDAENTGKAYLGFRQYVVRNHKLFSQGK